MYHHACHFTGLRERKRMYFFLYVYLISITLTRHIHDKDTGQSPAISISCFRGTSYKLRQHKRRGAVELFKTFRSQATQSKSET